MLTHACNVSPGDLVSCDSHAAEVVARVEVKEDSTVIIEFESGRVAWTTSNRIVLKKDKFQTFFAGVQ